MIKTKDNKDNEVQDLSEATRIIGIESVAVSKAVERVPSVEVDISREKTTSKIKTKLDENSVTDIRHSVNFVFNEKRSGIKTHVKEHHLETTDHLKITEDNSKIRFFNTSYEKKLYQSASQDTISSIELKQTKVRLGINTSTVSKVLKKGNTAMRRTSRLMRSSSAIQNGESTVDKEAGKAVKNTAMRYTGKSVKKMLNPVVKWIKRIFIKIMSKIAVGLSMLIIPVIVACICASAITGVFGGSGGDEVITKYENYFNQWSESYDSDVGMFEQNHPDGSVICNYGTRGRCDWKAVLAIMQSIFEDPSYSEEEQKVLKIFEKQKKSGMYETHIETNNNGEYTLEIQNASFDDYIDCLKENTNYITGNIITIAREYYQSEEFLNDFSIDFKVRYGSSENIEGGVVVSGNSELGNAIANKALTRVGYMYVWGGCHSSSEIKNPNWTKFDCSGLVNWAYYQSGVDIGAQTTKSLSKMGKKINFSELQPGDILLYSSDGTYNGIHHVTIYIGGGRVVHAPSRGKAITTKSVENDRKHLYSCRRLY